jgi:low affinity Fe/Cu permease
MGERKQLVLLVCMAALLAAVQLPGVTSQSIYRSVLLASGLGNFSCSSKATRVLKNTITVSPANICKSFGMGNANVLTYTGGQSWSYIITIRTTVLNTSAEDSAAASEALDESIRAVQHGSKKQR